MTYARMAFTVAVSALVGHSAAGQFVVPNTQDDGWDRGVTPLSTYAEWDFFSSPFGPNSPQMQAVVGSLPPDAADFDSFDESAETSGTFITGGGNIYSFSGLNTPLTISPSFGLGYGFKTTVVFQARTLGAEPDQGSFLLDGRKEPAEVVELDRTNVGGGLGGTQLDVLARFEIARNDPMHTVFFSAAQPSLSYDRGIIDTFTEPMDCPVDLDLNGEVDFFDALQIISDIEREDGDWNGDGDTTPQDAVDFLTELEAGCDP